MFPKNEMVAPKIRKGAKGISLLIVIRPFFKSNNKIPAAAPIQKDMIIAEIPLEMPSKNPIPRASLASPNPIHFPEDANHRIKNGTARIGPAKMFIMAGKIKKVPGIKLKNADKKESPAKRYANPSGIILCLKSYIEMTTRTLQIAPKIKKLAKKSEGE